MSQIIHYTHCPVCGSAELKNVLSAKDHTVSGEIFPIAECNGCSLRFTQDAPDAASIAPYYRSEDYISHSNTSKGLINRLYQSVRKRTLSKKRKLVQRITGMGKGYLLDVGSGTGAFVSEMTLHGWDVTGLEPDEGARQVARKEYNIELEDTNQFYQLAAESFDAITLWHVLEHVHELSLYVQHLKVLLKEKGKLLIAVPNYTSLDADIYKEHWAAYDVPRHLYHFSLSLYVQHLKVLLKEKGKLLIAVPNYTSLDADIYKEHWAAYDVPRHLYHFSPQSMQVLMEKHGLKVLEYKPMWYDSFYISMLSSKYKNVKTNLPASFINGFRSNLNALVDVKRCSSVIYIISK